MAEGGVALEGPGPSPAAPAAAGHGEEPPRPALPPHGPDHMLNGDAGPCGQPRAPLRRPFNGPTDLAVEQPPSPRKRRPYLGVDTSMDPKVPFGPVPAVAKASLATPQGKGPERLAGWRQRGIDSINVLQESSRSPASLKTGGPRFRSGDAERGGGNARFRVPLLQGQGPFPLKGPHARGPPRGPTGRWKRSEQPPENWRMARKEGRAPVSLPLAGPQRLAESWRRPVTAPPCRIPALLSAAALPSQMFRPPPSSAFPCCQLPCPRACPLLSPPKEHVKKGWGEIKS